MEVMRSLTALAAKDPAVVRVLTEDLQAEYPDLGIALDRKIDCDEPGMVTLVWKAWKK